MMHDLPGLLLILSDMNLVEDCTYIQKHTHKKLKCCLALRIFTCLIDFMYLRMNMVMVIRSLIVTETYGIWDVLHHQNPEVLVCEFES